MKPKKSSNRQPCSSWENMERHGLVPSQSHPLNLSQVRLPLSEMVFTAASTLLHYRSFISHWYCKPLIIREVPSISTYFTCVWHISNTCRCFITIIDWCRSISSFFWLYLDFSKRRHSKPFSSIFPCPLHLLSLVEGQKCSPQVSSYYIIIMDLNRINWAIYSRRGICWRRCIDVCFRSSLWFLLLRSAPRVTYLCGASRLFLQLCQPLTTASQRFQPWPRPRPQVVACTRTHLLPPSHQLLRPWSSCLAEVTAATGTPPPPMQQHTPHRPPPGGTQAVVRILSAVCCTASPQPTSISLPLVPPTSVWHPGPRPTVPTS